MADQKQDETKGDGGRGQQAISVQRSPQDRQLSRDQIPTARRITPRPLSLMRRMLDDLDDLGLSMSPLGFASPFSTMRRMFENMERMFDTGFDTNYVGDVDWRARDYVWAPRIEITQREDKLVVRADLPGIPQDKIQISAEGDSLVIEGERPLPAEQGEDVWTSERAHGPFRRVVALPDGVDLDKVQARYENGVLEMSIPLSVSQTRGRRIEIQAAGKDQPAQNPPPTEGAAQQKQVEKH